MYAHINNVNIGDGITICGYSDRHAYTVIAKTLKTITVQQDDAKLDGWKPDISPGGFAGHCNNQNNQDSHYIYTQNKKNFTQILHANKDGKFKEHGSNHPNVILGRHEFYDYNF
jgi:hypothetical protein